VADTNLFLTFFTLFRALIPAFALAGRHLSIRFAIGAGAHVVIHSPALNAAEDMIFKLEMQIKKAGAADSNRAAVDTTGTTDPDSLTPEQRLEFLQNQPELLRDISWKKRGCRPANPQPSLQKRRR
jgi:hypothetical protein